MDEDIEYNEWRTAPGPYPGTTLSDTLSYEEYQQMKDTRDE